MSVLAANRVADSQAVYHLPVCPRCGEEHCVSVSPLEGQPILSSSEVPYTDWAVCESTGQPVLFRGLSVIERAERGDYDG